MKYRTRTGAMALGLSLAAIAGCADDGTPNRPEDQKATGGAAGKATSSAGATNRGGTTSTTGTGGTTSVGSGGIASVAGQSTTTNTAGETSVGAGGAGEGGATTTTSGGANVGTAGSTQVGTGGATAVGGATNRGGTSGAAGSAGRTATGGVPATGGGATVAGSAGKAATGGAPATGGSPPMGGSAPTGGNSAAGAAGLGTHLGTAGSTSATPSCVVYVNGASGDDWNEGTSWAAARKTVQSGIDKAQEQGGCDVWVAAGIYKPTGSTIRTVSILLRPNIRVFGGFFGDETVLEQRKPQTHVTTLSGDIGVVGDASDNSYHVVTGAEGATLDGFTITAGNANEGSMNTSNGGGLFNTAKSLVVANCTFSGNLAAGYNPSGAGLYSSGDGLTIRNCTFTDNTAENLHGGEAAGGACGGALAFIGKDVLIETSSFVSNIVKNAVGVTNRDEGGALCTSYAPNAIIRNCTFTKNTAPNGGAVSASDTGTTIQSSAFAENTALARSGAIHGHGYLTLSDCQFRGNSAAMYAGALSVAYLTADRCVFTANQGTANAGALYLNGSDSTITNSVFYGNTSGAEGGGAIYLYDGAALKFVNSTIARNTSTIGGAVFARAVTSRLTLLNSILWQNSPDEVSGGTTSATYTINTGSNLVGTGNSGTNPQFVDVTTGDLRLKSGSLALNAGTAEGSPVVDLLGVVRDSQPDLGAYEGGVSP